MSQFVGYRPDNLSYPASYAYVASPATTPAKQVIKAAAGRLIGLYLNNSGSGVRSVKFFDELTANVTLGTTAADFEIDIPAGASVNLKFEGGIPFANGLVISETTAKGLTDNTGTGLGANEVTGILVYA